MFGQDHHVKCKPYSIKDVDISFFKKGIKSQIQDSKTPTFFLNLFH